MYRILFFLFLLPNFCLSQSLEELEDALKAAQDKNNAEEIIFTHKKLQSYYAKVTDWENFTRQYLEIAAQYYYQDDMNAFQSYADSALLAAQQYDIDSYSEVYSLIWNYLGIHYSYIGDTEKALMTFLKDLEISESLSKIDSTYDDLSLGQSYENIATQYSTLGDYSKAFDYYTLALQKYDPQDKSTATAYVNLGVDYQKQEKYQRAAHYFNQALEIFNQLKNDQEYVSNEIWVYKQLTVLSNDMKHFDDSYKYLEQVNELTPNKNDLDAAWYYQVRGGTDLQIGNLSDAEQHFFKALTIYTSLLPEKHPDLSACLDEIGDYYRKLESHEQALNYYHSALVALLPSFNANAVEVNPTIEQAKYDIESLVILKHKAQSLRAVNKLQASKSTLQLA
ncbi:MAG: tetratricopeptide repeat protein, partial [Bacteroidota bacterium]